MAEFNMYGIKVALKECRDNMNAMRAQWLIKYPHDLVDVDFTRKEEAFFKTRDLANRARELDNQLEHLREISAMVYALSRLAEELTGQCKLSRDVTRAHIERITMTKEQIAEADARRKQVQWQEDQRPTRKRKR